MALAITALLLQVLLSLAQSFAVARAVSSSHSRLNVLELVGEMLAALFVVQLFRRNRIAPFVDGICRRFLRPRNFAGGWRGLRTAVGTGWR
jgi:hypothetical protein